MNNDTLYNIQKLSNRIKKELPQNKLLRMWELGDFLVKNNITSQKEFWEIQEMKIYVNRALLLRSYWVRKAFTKEEIIKIRLPVSKVIAKISYLAENSKKLNKEEKIILKNLLLSNKIPNISLSKKSNVRKNESKTLFYGLLEALNNLDEKEINLFKNKTDLQDFEKLKHSIFYMLQRDLPNKDHIEIFHYSKELCKKEKLIQLFKIFEIMEIASINTKQDSKIMMKKIFDPNTLKIFLKKMFFNKNKKEI